MYCDIHGAYLIYGWILSNEKVVHIDSVTNGKYWHHFHALDNSEYSDFVCGTKLASGVMPGMTQEVILKDEKVDNTIIMLNQFKDELADYGIYLSPPDIFLVSFE